MDQTEKQQQIEELQCSICLCIFVEPLTLPCNHNFCKQCISDLLDNEIEIKCPYCRQCCNQKQIKFNAALSLKIQQDFPSDFRERQNEIKSLQVQGQKVRILYGNHFKKLPSGKQVAPGVFKDKEWTFYVKIDKQPTKSYILKVDVELDPTFEGVVLSLKTDPLQLTRVGYGEFRINFKIHFQRHLKLKPIELFHDLVFNAQGSHKVHTLTI